MNQQIAWLAALEENELFNVAKELQVPYDLALAFHPELDIDKSTAVHEYFLRPCR